MAQFVVVPPLSMVAGLFKAATRQELIPDISWSSLLDVSATEIESFRPYIRACHQKIFNETLAGRGACALLRQLLRPHGYRIETIKSGWVLRHGSPGRGVQIQEGKHVVWTL